MSLRSMSLTVWADRTAALPKRFDEVLIGAAELMEPDAVHVTIPGHTLRNPDEIRTWLKEMETMLLEKLESAGGGPLIVR